MNTQVYKFGGASIATPECMQALMPIIDEASGQLVLVVSALGKTTNALESIVAAACKGKQEDANKLASDLADQHREYARTLLNDEYYTKAEHTLGTFFDALHTGIKNAVSTNYDHSYDQIVCLGELLSTVIFTHYLQQKGMDIVWLDVRSIIRTDDTYREGRVDWDYSARQAIDTIGSLLKQGKHVLTQGFIGSSPDNSSVTLGREGTDYTAAMLAAMLGADNVTIWKDVAGLQNADPKLFPNTVKIEAITYHEVIEMAYYGAQVIHPKTIKPLQNNNIPLYVKCFTNRELKGTMICNEVSSIFYPPLIVLKKNQLLLQVTSKDFSFITEDNLAELYSIFHDLKIKISLIQNTAINFVACINNEEDRVQELVTLLSKHYNVFRNENVQLLTIRHYTPEIVFDLTRNKYILLEQKTRNTVQVVMK